MRNVVFAQAGLTTSAGPKLDDEFVPCKRTGFLGNESGIAQHRLNLRIRETETGVGVGLAQVFAIVRGEIDDGDAPTRSGDAGSTGDHGFRRLGIVQHLVEQHRIKAARGKRDLREITLDQLDGVGAQVLEPGAGDAQHVGALVESDDVGSVRRKQFGNTAGAGPNIEHAAKASLAGKAQQHFGKRGFYRAILDVQRTQFVPFLGMAREPVKRVRLTRGADCIKVLAIFGTATPECDILLLCHGKKAGNGRCRCVV